MPCYIHGKNLCFPQCNNLAGMTRTRVKNAFCSAATSWVPFNARLMTILILWTVWSGGAELDKGLPCSNGQVPTKETFEIVDKCWL